jgi:spore maturation protein CgeB
MVNYLLVAPLEDDQTGKYLHDSIIEAGHQVAYLDWKAIINQTKSHVQLNGLFLEAIRELKPDITLIIKCPFLLRRTIMEAREIHNHKIVGWIFDCTINGTLVQHVEPYIELIREFDIFYTIDNEAVAPLTSRGVNAKWLSEGCFVSDHQEQVINSIQKKKYGSDVVFLGSVGGIHPNRTEILEFLYDSIIPFKLYGEVYFDKEKEPVWVKDSHTGFAAINNYHSIVVNSSNIILGIDGWPERSKSYSARLYRTLAAGGFYLTTHTKDIEEEFIPGVHLDTYRTKEELVEKIIYYMNNEDKRKAIAEAGRQLVLDKHTFKHRIETITNDCLL